MTVVAPSSEAVRSQHVPDAPTAEPVLVGLTVDDQGATCTLTLSGSLDADSVIAFDSQLDQLIFGEFDQVVLDVGRLDHLDEAGLRGLRRLGEIAAFNGTSILLRYRAHTVRCDSMVSPTRSAFKPKPGPLRSV
jgi:ABC-type transporter Mla MlaB component